MIHEKAVTGPVGFEGCRGCWMFVSQQGGCQSEHGCWIEQGHPFGRGAGRGRVVTNEPGRFFPWRKAPEKEKAR